MPRRSQTRNVIQQGRFAMNYNYKALLNRDNATQRILS